VLFFVGLVMWLVQQSSIRKQADFEPPSVRRKKRQEAHAMLISTYKAIASLTHSLAGWLAGWCRDGTNQLTRDVVEDRYRNLDQVKDAMRQAGLESSNLIIGVDYSKSNEYNGMISYDGKCLHEVTIP